MQPLKKKVYTRLRKLFNNLRRPYPAPQKVVGLAQAISEEGVEACWQGPRPASQTLHHPADFLDVGELEFISPFVLSIRNGSVVGSRGDVVTAQGTIFHEISPEIPRRNHHHFLLDGGNLPKPTRIGGTVAVLNCGPYRNYFHFLFDAISRLHFFRQASISADYYCVAQNTPFQRELTALLGIEAHKIVPLKKGTHLVAERLIAASLPGYHTLREQVHLKDEDTYRFVRETILSRIDTSSDRYPSRMYIQRTTTRTVANEAELLEKLRTRGAWEVVRLEEHSVAEQAAMFYHAREIVSVHGAGLANLIFAQPTTQVVEIFPPELLEPIYYQMATLFGLHYEPIIAESADLSPSASSSGSLRVDPDAVLRSLAQ